jgi:hypothetical protein
MHEDLTEMVLERAAEIRMDRNQVIRQQMIDGLAKDKEDAAATARDPKLAYVLLAALKDSDTIDIKRLGLKQNEREIDNRGRVLSFLENISAQVKGNPYYVENPTNSSNELKGRPTTFYDKEDFVDGELEIETKLTNYHDFMSSRNAIPSSANRTDNDSAS